MANVEKDAVSGTDTTGHQWDGIKELNTPLPRWWLYVLYATIVWSFAYWVVYPAWPSLSNYTKGVFGYSSRAELDKDVAAARKAQESWRAKLAAAEVAEIVKDKDLLVYATAGGKAVFAENCQPCHGAGGAGRPGGYPVLADDDWLWGGAPDEILATIRFGVRSGHKDARVSEMPRFGEQLKPDEIAALAEHVLSLSGKEAKSDAGVKIFAEQCGACHGDDGKGNKDLGAPNLADGIWLYGGASQTVAAQIAAPRHGVMPAWDGRLDPVALKMVAAYIHALGGGK
ncbi:MAG: cytochrome-c oxidase, cbb3-type subunit III [Rhodospirillales bacterium]|nr:cytochrome-c oxidase, cbb3-type subunit III [Rhodospirillales bacterium]